MQEWEPVKKKCSSSFQALYVTKSMPLSFQDSTLWRRILWFNMLWYCIVNICQCIKASNKISLVFSFLSSKQITPVNGANGTTPSTPTSAAPASSTDIKVEDEKPVPDFLDSLSKPEEKSKIGFPASQMNNLNVGDYRTLVKTLVCGVKTITWGCASCKVSIWIF